MASNPVDRVLERLPDAQRGQVGWRARCPAHESRPTSRTLSVREAPSGAALLKCFHGCDVQQITAALGLELGDLFPPRTDDAKRAPRVRRPWPVSEIVRALESELAVAFVLLADISSGRTFTATDRGRAGLARERIAALMRELAS